jgi:hypothetical protein
MRVITVGHATTDNAVLSHFYVMKRAGPAKYAVSIHSCVIAGARSKETHLPPSSRSRVAMETLSRRLYFSRLTWKYDRQAVA